MDAGAYGPWGHRAEDQATTYPPGKSRAEGPVQDPWLGVEAACRGPNLGP